MQYLLLIYGNETYWNKLSEAEQGKVSQEYGEFTQSIAGSGHLSKESRRSCRDLAAYGSSWPSFLPAMVSRKMPCSVTTACA
jgi:hypothetical protein